MVEDFGAGHGMGRPESVAVEPGPPSLAAGSFRWDGDFVRAWQVSDGLNFAIVTYVCEVGREGLELAACEQIVRSLSFASRPPAVKDEL